MEDTASLQVSALPSGEEGNSKILGALIQLSLGKHVA